MDLGLAGSKAVVTGGSKGMGLAIAQTLAAEGASVAVMARTRIESTSPPTGPIEVPPTSTPRSWSSISFSRPSLPGPWIQPRVEDEVRLEPTRIFSPCSRAWCSVRPAEPISGSVKVTRGSAR